MATTVQRQHSLGPAPTVKFSPASAAEFFDVTVTESYYSDQTSSKSIDYSVAITRKDVAGSSLWSICGTSNLQKYRNRSQHGEYHENDGGDSSWSDVFEWDGPERKYDEHPATCRDNSNSASGFGVGAAGSGYAHYYESYQYGHYTGQMDGTPSYSDSTAITIYAQRCDQVTYEGQFICAYAMLRTASGGRDYWPSGAKPTGEGWDDGSTPRWTYSIDDSTGGVGAGRTEVVSITAPTASAGYRFDHWEFEDWGSGYGWTPSGNNKMIGRGTSWQPPGESTTRYGKGGSATIGSTTSASTTLTIVWEADDTLPCTYGRSSGGLFGVYLIAVFVRDEEATQTETSSETTGGQTTGGETTGGEATGTVPATETGTRTSSAVKVTVTFDSSQGYANAGGAQTSVVRTGYVGDTRTVELNAYPESIPGQESCPTYKFSGWYENGVCLSTDEKYFLEHVLKDGYSEESPEERTIEARFERAGPTVRLTTTTSPVVNGWTVDPGVAEYTKSGSCANNSSATVMLVASSDGASEYRFVRWETSGTGITLSDANSPVTTATLAFPDSTVVREVTATAILEQRETACVAFNAHAAEGGTVSGGGTVCGKAGDRLCTPQALVATPSTGWRFVKWTNASGTTVSESASFSPCATATAGTTKTFSYTAHFVRARITLVAAIGGAFGNGGWAVSPDTQTADAPTDGSTTVSFVLNAVDGQPYVHRRDDYNFGGVPQKYDFDEWETNDEGVTFEDATKPVTTVTVTVPNDGSDRTVNVAAFLKERPKVTVTVTTAPSPAAGGQTAGDGTVSAYRGDIVVWDIYAFPAEDGGFLWWTKDGVMQDLQAEDDIQLNAPDEEGGSVTYALVAHFLGETGTSDETEGHTTTPPEPPGPGSGTTGGQTSATSGTSGTTGTTGTTGTAVETGVVVFKTIITGTGQGTTNPEERTVRAEVGETVTFESTATAAAGSRFQEWLDASKARITTDATVEAEATVTSEPQVVKLYAVMAIVGPLIYGSGGKLLHNGVCDALVYADEVVGG